MLLEIGYIVLTIITLSFLLFIGFKAISNTSNNPKKDKLTLVIGLLSWQLFIIIISLSGIIKSYNFPPRFAIAFIIPSFIFTGIFLSRNKNKQWIQAIPEQWIVYYQSFRVMVETLFVFTVAKGILPTLVSIEGYNFDMILGASAPIITYLVYNKKILSRKVILIWNFTGLAILASVIFLFLTGTYKPELYGSETPLIPLEAFTYPYVLIAGFLMPVAVFLHVLSIIQLSRKVS